MPSTKKLLTFLGTALGLALALYLGGTFVMSDTTTADDPKETPPKSAKVTDQDPAKPPPGTATATFGNGCFWCTEAVFQRLKGVKTVVSGFSGGHVKNPTYRQVCTGTTGHAEAIQLTYDPKEISFDDLLAVFWHSHDPTTKDRQGNDVGTQYRSVIFYHSDEQKQLAEKYKKKLDESGLLSRTHRHRNRAVHRVLRRRRLSPELLQPELGRGILPGDHRPQAGKAEEGIQGQAQGRGGAPMIQRMLLRLVSGTFILLIGVANPARAGR